MPQLPSTLGPLRVPQASNGIARVDTASAVGIREQGVQSLLQGVAGGLQQVQTANDTGELANAQSQFLQAKVAADNAYQDDNDWQTIPARYGASVDKARNDSAQMISNATVRNQFLRDSALEAQRGTIQIGQLAKGKQSDQGRANLIVGLNNNLQTATLSGDTNTRAGLLTAMTQQIDSAAGKGWLDQEGAARLKVEYGNKFVAQRQGQLQQSFQNDLDTITGNAISNPDVNANAAAIDAATNKMTGSLPADIITEMATKAKQTAFRNAIASPNMTPDKGYQIITGNQPLNTVPQATQATPQFMQAIVSRGEFGKTGDKSPRGALGKFQMMPATARAMALKMGVEFDQTKLQYDDQYGEKLATGFVNDLLTKYNGDQVLAAAAYNAGEPAVDNWIRLNGDPRTGQISDAEFAARIPFDKTRSYVQRVGGGLVSQPTPRDPILRAAVNQYPGLAKYANNTVVVQKQNPSGDDRQLESYPPWEGDNPNPGKHTTELYVGGTDAEKGNLVAGDMLHYIGGIDPTTNKPVDPQFHAFKDKLIKSLTPEQLNGERQYYEQSKKYYGENPPSFDQWMETSRADELMMGYLTPDKADGFKHYYSPQQKQILEQAKYYLKNSDTSAPQSQFNIATLGGDPAQLPEYMNIIKAKQDRQSAETEAQWTAQRKQLADVWDANIASIQSTGKPSVNLDDFKQAFPGDDFAALQRQQDLAQSFNGIVQPVVSGTASEAKAAVDKLTPVAGAFDFDDQQKKYEVAQKLYNARVEGLTKDPAAYVQQNDAVASDAANELETLDISDPEQAAQAATDLNQIRSAQRRLGVSDENIRPLTDAKAAAVGAQLMSAEPAKVTGLIDQYATIYGADGTKQILAAKGVSPSMRYIAAIDNPADAVLRSRAVMAAQTPHDDLVNGMKSKAITEDQVKTAIQSVVPQALAARPGWADYETGMTNTAMWLINQGMGQAQAVDAVNAPWKRSYNTTDSLSVPTTYDFNLVQSGLNGAVQNIDKFDIDPKGGGPLGVSANWSVEQTQQALKMAHRWVTLPDDSGAILTYDQGDGLPGAPVMLKNKQRLIVKFSDAQAGQFGRQGQRTYGRVGNYAPVAPVAPIPRPVAPSAPTVTAPTAPAAPQAPRPPRAPTAPTAPVLPRVQ